MRDNPLYRCISACREKDRLGIPHGWCWACVQEMRGHWREEVEAVEAHRDALLAALKGVIRVADRKTDEFDAARAAIAKAEGR